MSELTDAQLDELERLAEAFAEDEWVAEGPIVIDTDREFIASCADTTVPAELCVYLAAHIAAADPPTVLALVREVRRLRAAIGMQDESLLRELRAEIERRSGETAELAREVRDNMNRGARLSDHRFKP